MKHTTHKSTALTWNKDRYEIHRNTDKNEHRHGQTSNDNVATVTKSNDKVSNACVDFVTVSLRTKKACMRLVCLSASLQVCPFKQICKDKNQLAATLVTRHKRVSEVAKRPCKARLYGSRLASKIRVSKIYCVQKQLADLQDDTGLVLLVRRDQIRKLLLHTADVRTCTVSSVCRVCVHVRWLCTRVCVHTFASAMIRLDVCAHLHSSHYPSNRYVRVCVLAGQYEYACVHGCARACCACACLSASLNLAVCASPHSLHHRFHSHSGCDHPLAGSVRCTGSARRRNLL